MYDSTKENPGIERFCQEEIRFPSAFENVFKKGAADDAADSHIHSMMKDFPGVQNNLCLRRIK